MPSCSLCFWQWTICNHSFWYSQTSFTVALQELNLNCFLISLLKNAKLNCWNNTMYCIISLLKTHQVLSGIILVKTYLHYPENTLRITEFCCQLGKHLDEQTPRYLCLPLNLLLTFLKLAHCHYSTSVAQAVKLSSQLPNFSLLGIYHFLKCCLQPRSGWNPRKEFIKYTFPSSSSHTFSWQNLRPKPLSDVHDTWLSIKKTANKANVFLEQSKQKRDLFFFLHYILKSECLSLLSPPFFKCGKQT